MAEMAATEQIRITPDTAERLYELQNRKETYNDVVQRLLDAHADEIDADA